MRGSELNFSIAFSSHTAERFSDTPRQLGDLAHRHGLKTEKMDDTSNTRPHFPTSAGIFFGLGLGGFFDGIVLHQILQWHHMVSSTGYPPDSLYNLKINTFFDGLFHATTYVFVVIGLLLFWRAAHRFRLWWPGKMLAGSLFIGFGLFNVVEGAVSHHLLGLHHVNETVPREQWIYWDIGFLVLGIVLLLFGWRLLKAGERAS